MFRQIEIHCIVENHGPKSASGPAAVVISRPSDDGVKILKRAAVPGSFPPHELLEVVAQTTAWFATPVPYRCEIRFEGAGDADPTNDAREIVYPEL